MVGGNVGAERHCGHPSEDLMPIRRESAGKAGELHRAGGCILTGFVEPELCPSRGHSDPHSETGLGPGTHCGNAAVLAAGHSPPLSPYKEQACPFFSCFSLVSSGASIKPGLNFLSSL